MISSRSQRARHARQSGRLRASCDNAETAHVRCHELPDESVTVNPDCTHSTHRPHPLRFTAAKHGPQRPEENTGSCWQRRQLPSLLLPVTLVNHSSSASPRYILERRHIRGFRHGSVRGYGARRCRRAAVRVASPTRRRSIDRCSGSPGRPVCRAQPGFPLRASSPFSSIIGRSARGMREILLLQASKAAFAMRSAQSAYSLMLPIAG
jgi:hypothetical protein